MFKRTAVMINLLMLMGTAQASNTQPEVAAEYVTTICATPCKSPETRQWYFWRSANRIEIRDSSNALGEIWKQDNKGRISYIYLEPAHHRGIEYNPTDLKLLNHKRSWDKLAGIVAPEELQGLTPVSETIVSGYKAVVYNGSAGERKVEVVWIPELQLATKIVNTYPDHQSTNELQTFLTEKDGAAATSDSQLADYQLVDFTDVGDMETSDAMSWLKQALAAPGHDHHD